MGDLRCQPSEGPWTAAFVRLVEKASLISLHDVSWLLGYGPVVLADLPLRTVWAAEGNNIILSGVRHRLRDWLCWRLVATGQTIVWQPNGRLRLGSWLRLLIRTRIVVRATSIQILISLSYPIITR
jgi:hypothetical protein